MLSSDRPGSSSRSTPKYGPDLTVLVASHGDGDMALSLGKVGGLESWLDALGSILEDRSLFFASRFRRYIQACIKHITPAVLMPGRIPKLFQPHARQHTSRPLTGTSGYYVYWKELHSHGGGRW